MELRDKRIWLVGATSAIGSHMVPQLVTKQAQLAITAPDASVLESLATAHARAALPIVVKPADVAQDAELARVARELQDQWGQIDALVYLAGAWDAIDVVRWDTAAFERVVMLNYVGMQRAIACVLPDMIQR